MSAVLGPTNTGKTYLAIERMLGYRTGMIGFPLRLLARENYDKVVKAVGARHVALVTGEEKIVPKSARYFLCTVESMPVDRLVEFLAIDEVQLCGDRERGFMFTDRILHARGLSETMFLGADTMRPLIRALVPGVEFIARPRFSKLSYSGEKKLTRLPRRSAVVAFTANDVYAIAEQVRRSRGGAAVVLGALSPRTRNAQVAMYQAGEVDYLVATDAIGMGLNMDIDHVAFWRHRKFDGYRNRNLTIQEIAQIAGRAGRHMTDGTFGTLSGQSSLPPDVIEAIEEHRFETIWSAWWRNPDLSFKSIPALLAGLEARPPTQALMRTPDSGDHLALKSLAGDDDIARLATDPDRVRLLWEVCQIPDFRKTMPEVHVRLLARIYQYLSRPQGRLPADWVAGQLAQLDRTDGDIDTLMARISHTRTWTFISHRSDWLDDAQHWQERARVIEDQLSDALHEGLTQRFVDRRSAVLVRTRGKENLSVLVDDDDAVCVEGESVGRLEALTFVPDSVGTGDWERLVAAATNRGLGGEMRRRVERLEGAPDAEFGLTDDGRILWGDTGVGRMVAGGDLLSPAVKVPASDILPQILRQRVEARLGTWLEGLIRRSMAALLCLEADGLSGAARGLIFQLREGLGSMPRTAVQPQIAALTAGDRKALRTRGVRIGLAGVFIPTLLKPKAQRMRCLLWATVRQQPPPALPAPGLVTVARDQTLTGEFYEAIGYRVITNWAVRLDILDRAAVRLLKLAKKGPFAMPSDMASLLGVGAEAADAIVLALGYKKSEESATYERRSGRHRSAAKQALRRGSRHSGKPSPDSPFAQLADLRLPS
ncbi:MAG: disulfide oxidoreductase [Rhodospirillaceae bacterium]|nr:disulfide oxidoreductase [Rhodospirillaceae bacterium]MBT5457912.1 disulfide oxidoreductase [Rhodospirillaceae bacterium]